MSDTLFYVCNRVIDTDPAQFETSQDVIEHLEDIAGDDDLDNYLVQEYRHGELVESLYAGRWVALQR